MEDNQVTKHVRQGTAQRSDGKQSRDLILEATLRIIAREGIRQVRHRAIAAEAGVSLSSTTYYFKSIKELINASFTYFNEQNAFRLEKLEDAGMRILSETPPSQLRKRETKLRIAEELAKLLAKHVQDQVKKVEQRHIEYYFRNEALHTPDLAKLIEQKHDGFVTQSQAFLTKLGSSDPETDAHKLVALVFYYEQESLIKRKSKRKKKLDAEIAFRRAFYEILAPSPLPKI